jgi:2-polyprenyl-3-methyl-5-hydroxy-6-metoxy-1,4-benzoquinol methylase
MAKSFKDYARIFDVIYKDKNYTAECAFLNEIFRSYSKKPVQKVLDIACGTGNHIIPLAKMGFKVAAQDLSSDMLAVAKSKCSAKNLKVDFLGCFPMQSFKHAKKFDAIIAMFSSIDYVLKPKELKRTLGNIRNCLKKDGLLVFDFWNKPCVDKYFTPYKRKVFLKGNEKVVRVSKTTLDKRGSIAKVNFSCDYYVRGKRVARIIELHRMKYYKISQMRKIVESSGYKVLGVFPFMHKDKKVTDKDWNISLVATPLVS